jgi:polysaccharide biosynthesis/export protein
MTKPTPRTLFVLSLIVLITLIGLLTSCVTQKNLEYMQDKNKDIRKFYEAEIPEYRLKPNDELYIQISSLDEGAATMFSSSKELAYNVGTIQPYGASLLSHSVDAEGFLSLPVIGRIQVNEKTLSEVREILKDSLNHVLNQPVVSVKLVNRYVSVLGEVRNPGHFAIAQEKFSIYDAIALAGDITVFGNRNQVTLVRNENGQNIRVNVDLNRSDILESGYYNLRPNDVIYVKPLRKRFWGFDQFPFAIILSTITTAILIYTVVKP